MVTTPGSAGRRQILLAVQKGWTAFCGAPWPFVLFTLLTGALSLLFQSLASLDSLPVPSSRLPWCRCWAPWWERWAA
ncbi:MAG: hypothetical protein AAFX65_08555 [Cyanobacteria bacterium J06638_7]